MFSSIFIIIVSITLIQCEWNETIVRQYRPLPSYFFDEIVIDGAFDIYLSQSNGVSLPTVELETTVTAQRHILIEILDNHILSIHFKRPFVVHKNINAYIQFHSPLRRYTIKGTGNTITDDHGISNTGNDKFILENRGTANVAMHLNVYELEVYLSGTGNSRFWGQVREQALFETKGVGDVNAMNLLAKQVKVHSSGVSTVRVAATDDAQIEVTGVSTVYYRLLSGKKPSKEISTGLGQIISIS
ncbi:unnamed protein product [Adineta steineri]|uniref:Putative auto-transporter adhesin head GIN domain-containing protein n=1 Tax=Adineta steineri TaxID=433720 RepID=A0A815TBW4_9BILA|nr:unnamed protein product [Adineta steineri]CAF1503219.1 unnamed protein product [Adineta steineri]CAF3697299.1 unnamed protein product [Adineta steineri]CAF3872612.1 unnamed protein product [Adineta steineri]